MRHFRSVLPLVATIILWIATGSCSESNLYGVGMEDSTPNRLGITGRVCTDDPKEAGFPVRVVFLVDVASGPLFAEFDPELVRIQALRNTLSIHNGNDAFSFAVITYAANPRLLAPEEGYFTRNAGELDNAVAMAALPQGCQGGICRDSLAALELTQSIIDGDLANMSAGERIRTQYAVVMLSAGGPDPLSCDYECCNPEEEDCDYSECIPSLSCTRTLLSEKVLDMREDTLEGGALSFSLHSLFLAAEDEDQNTTNEPLYQEMAFVGQGRYERFNVADAITLDRIGLLRISSLLESKAFIVTNASTLPGNNGPQMDSDGDGMADSIEEAQGTSATNSDSDGDGIGDFVETLVSFDPTVADTAPQVCTEIEGPPYEDQDNDRLNECEELLLGTDPSLPDSDGDGIPDWMEVHFGTDYLHNDALDDSDGDGVTNGTELKNHTDPRASDATSHLADSYRYEIADEGLVSEPNVSNPTRVTGISVLAAGEDSTGGLGTLRYSPSPNPTLSWQDPQDGTPTESDRVTLTESGEYTIVSPSQEEDLERWISVQVNVNLLPPTVEEELLLVEMSERQCLSFTVRNIRLVETSGASDQSGRNDVFIYFAEAPAGHLTLPSLYRVAHIPVVYHDETGREPADLLVPIEDADFASIGL